jgi:S1-C subfamily serine protease
MSVLKARSSRPLAAVALLAALLLPAAALADGARMERDVVARVAAATVFIHAEWAGVAGEGSGFLAAPQGYIVTNRHVIRLDPRETADGVGEPRSVQVVLQSGETDERRFDARVVAVSPDEDLALLKIEGVDARPLAIGDSAAVSMSEDVWAFGFPLGSLLGRHGRNPSITVNHGSVSALRKSAGGALERIQTEALVTHGNSGGPLVTADGGVVGVIVSGIEDSSIREAIPTAAVRKLLRARIDRVTATPERLAAGGGRVEIAASLIEANEAAERVSATVTTSGYSQEVELARAGGGFRGSWVAPAAPTGSADARRYSIDLRVRFPSGAVDLARQLVVVGGPAEPAGAAPARPTATTPVSAPRASGKGPATTPEAWYAALLAALRAGDYARFEKLFTRRAAEDLSRDDFAAAVAHLRDLGESASFPEAAGGVKVQVRGGRALTTLKQEAGGWRADAPLEWLGR